MIAHEACFLGGKTMWEMVLENMGVKLRLHVKVTFKTTIKAAVLSLL